MVKNPNRHDRVRATGDLITLADKIVQQLDAGESGGAT
jgi:hypothetical protein